MINLKKIQVTNFSKGCFLANQRTWVLVEFILICFYFCALFDQDMSSPTNCFVGFLDQIRSGWIKLNQIGSDWYRLDQIESGWIRMDQIESGWIRMDQI